MISMMPVTLIALGVCLAALACWTILTANDDR
jgi:hypothetical protein